MRDRVKKKREKAAEVWCPECERLNRHVRLEEGHCPECHYMYLTRRT
jgi:Zn finger protein HypA/HybF involved in hydrogenase expression